MMKSEAGGPTRTRPPQGASEERIRGPRTAPRAPRRRRAQPPRLRRWRPPRRRPASAAPPSGAGGRPQGRCRGATRPSPAPKEGIGGGALRVAGAPPPAQGSSLAAALAGGGGPHRPLRRPSGGGGGGDPFNMGEAKVTPGDFRVRSPGSLQEEGDGPTGTGRVVVLFRAERRGASQPRSRALPSRAPPRAAASPRDSALRPRACLQRQPLLREQELHDQLE